MKKTRRDWIPFSFYDHTGMEKHLEKMAQKGWMLEELTSFGWKYREIQPQKLHFSVSFDTRASEFEPEPTEEQYTFQEFCQRSGWKLAAASGQMQVFYNEEEDPLPIQTDPEMEVRMVGKLARRMLPLYPIFLVLGFLLGGGWCYSLVHTPIQLLTTPGASFTGLCWLGIFLYFAADLITYLGWRRRALTAAQRGEFLPTRGSHKLLCVVVAVVLVGGVTFGLMKGIQTGAFSLEEQTEAPLSASDLTGVDEEKYLTTVSVDMSLFLDRQEVRCRTGFDQEEELPGMDYTLVKLHAPFLYNACFRELCREKEERVATLVDGNVVHAQYMEVESTSWGAEEAYQLNLAGEFQQEYILCWKDRIVQLGADWDLTTEQMAVAGEKLVNA